VDKNTLEPTVIADGVFTRAQVFGP